MSQLLPTGGFKWVKVKSEEISRPAKLNSKGYLLEVDVKYPKELHDSHNYPPCMCERLKIDGVEKLNKKVIGFMKDELGGEIIEEFVTLRPKMYSYRTSKKESKKCNGIKKCIVRKTITFEDYKNCLFSGETSYRSQLMFRSSRQRLRTLEVNKIALNKDDDK